MTGRWSTSNGRTAWPGLLELDPAFVDAAKADSWWQLLMLHGALGDGWRAEFLSYEASTYFGMLCAAYAPN
jgi:aromatic ring-opening dioxygenase LigB subunit